MRTYFFVFLLLLVANSCKKKTFIEEQNHVIYSTDTTVVPGNSIPEDSTITALTIQSYINSSYISLLGRQPLEVEFNAVLPVLSNDYSLVNRASFITDVINNNRADFANKLYLTQSSKLINGIDTPEINSQVGALDFILSNGSYQSIWPIAIYEKGRLIALKNCRAEVTAGTISHNEVQRRMIDNSFYDELNMGTENFVVSSFQNLIGRYPTSDEVTEGKNMVDGFSAQLFYQLGSSKEDYLDIFFSSNAYLEGVIQDNYVRYLLRNANSNEIPQHLQSISTQGYEHFLIELLSSNEYANVP